MEFKDIILLPIFFFFLCMIGLLVQEVRYKHAPYKYYLLLGLMTKMLGAMAYCAVYTLYYAGGDTTVYYDYASVILSTIMYDPELGFRILQAPAGHFDFATYDSIVDIWHFYRDPSTFMVMRLAVVLGLFCFNSFWVISLLFGAISFSGLWAMYRVLVEMYPKLYHHFAIAIFFIPSVFFWGSGLMKDTITLGALGWLVYAIYQIAIKRKRFISSIIIAWIAFTLIKEIKVYIIAALIPAAVYWIYRHYIVKLEAALRIVIWLVAGFSFSVYFYLFSGHFLGMVNGAMMSFVSRVIQFQSWHTFLAETRGQSGYSLGDMELTFGGIMAKFPASVVVTLFRPFLHEVTNPIMLLTSLEGVIFLLFTVYVFLRVGIFKTLGIILREPVVSFCIVFALIFAFAVGLTSYNFGALARYKIPCLPFYIIGLSLILHHYKVSKTQKLSVSS